MSNARSLPAVDFASAAECLKTIAHPARLALLQLLLHGRYSVGELAEAQGLAPNVTSEHLRLMERCGLLKGEREGRTVFYVIVEDQVGHIMACIENRFGI